MMEIKDFKGNVLTKQEVEAIITLYEWIGYEISSDSIEQDMKNSYLSFNEGMDDKYYCWYMDDVYDVLIEVGTETVIDDEKEICKRMGI